MSSKTTGCSQRLNEGSRACLLTKQEQINETVKGAGAAVCHTENPAALKRWMVADPEQARIVTGFEEMYCTPDQHTLNHEQGHASHETFKKQVTNMCDVIVTTGNPFMDSFNELMT